MQLGFIFQVSRRLGLSSRSVDELHCRLMLLFLVQHPFICLRRIACNAVPPRDSDSMRDMYNHSMAAHIHAIAALMVLSLC